MRLTLSRRRFNVLLAGAMGAPGRGSAADGVIRLPVRTRVETFKGTGKWDELRLVRELPVAGTAILICDMWDKHWCKGATERVNEMATRMDPVLRLARQSGIAVIHAPSDTMEFYKDYPQRRRIQGLPPVENPTATSLPDPPLPIDDSDGGCDTEGDLEHKAWSRQHPAISIGPDDVISDQGREVYSFLRHKGIDNLLVMGVHTNMCVLNRTFAIKQMTRWGVRCVLVRDLTDAMYDPKDRPFVSHAKGTELVVEYIEKYWCPSTTNGELTAALRR
jgi:nicotinamidase-related amidase